MATEEGLHFCNSDKMATNLTLMQHFLTLSNKILAKWHSFVHHSALSTDCCWAWLLTYQNSHNGMLCSIQLFMPSRIHDGRVNCLNWLSMQPSLKIVLMLSKILRTPMFSAVWMTRRKNQKQSVQFMDPQFPWSRCWGTIVMFSSLIRYEIGNKMF